MQIAAIETQQPSECRDAAMRVYAALLRFDGLQREKRANQSSERDLDRLRALDSLFDKLILHGRKGAPVSLKLAAGSVQRLGFLSFGARFSEDRDLSCLNREGAKKVGNFRKRVRN